jgi:hypothetical protein
MATTKKYNQTWNSGISAIDIEIYAIRKGGKWKNKKGEECGEGLFHHYKQLQTLLWPNKKWHKWNELLLRTFVENRICAILGPASSGKTREAADFGLCVYICFPKQTTILISSTDMRSLELRIWGEMKKNWMAAKSVYPQTPGYIIGSKQMITTDSVDSTARDFRCGIIGIPCMVGGSFVGLGKYVGIKNIYVILIADELQFMNKTFCDSIANLNKNEGFKGLGLGNPKDRLDALGILAEPKDGWDSVDEAEVTKTWQTRFSDGVCVQLVGTDSPNFDVPETEPIPFPFLISRKSIESDISFYGRDSLQFSMMNLGMMPKDAQSRRVITKSLCQQFNAFQDPIWQNQNVKKILGLDAAYGSVGGDRCMATEAWMGQDVRGKIIVAIIGTPIVIPVRTGQDKIPEDQIAEYVMGLCVSKGIEPGHVFYDATGKGSLGTSFGRIWSTAVNPIEFGGKPSSRPVGINSKVLCKDYYSKMVSELWFSTRLAIESDQIRGMSEELMNEGSLREWTIIAGNKIEVEPKHKTKERMGRSPDAYDSWVCTLEGARRLGFNIDKLGGLKKNDDGRWLKELLEKRNSLIKKGNLITTH